MASTLDWLRDRDDDALVALLRARPDLAVPAPTELSVLARRLDTPPSVWRVMETLHQFSVQVLQAILLLGGRHDPVSAAQIADFLRTGGLAPGPKSTAGATGRKATARPAERVVPTEADVRAVLDELETVALVRGGPAVRLSAAVPGALGEYPAGLGPPGELSPEQVERALAEATDDERALLERLAHGRPRGSLGGSGPVTTVAAGLVRRGLLLAAEVGTVLLPREVCLALRGSEPLGPVSVRVPDATTTKPGRTTVDGTAAAQALASVGALRSVLVALGRLPAPVLKSGGLGIRELRRLARAVGQQEDQVALELELLAATGLVAASEPRSRGVPSWTPTGEADDFLDAEDEQAWAPIAQAWLTMRRDPDRVGDRDLADKVVAALSAEVSWLRGPADRRFVLGVLEALPAGAGMSVDDLTRRIGWLAPLRANDRREILVRSVIAQATFLGLISFDSLSTAGRAVLRDDEDAATEALRTALPDPVDTIVVQADLTVVAPGRLHPQLAAQLGRVADIESAGTATVYRVTVDSLRRAFDAGLPAAEIHALFNGHSATGVPQGLSYLIDDVARRHGVLRAGAATSYLRSDDTALIDSAMAGAEAAGLQVRRLAPTVAICGSRVEDLLDILRGAGLVPAAEDVSGGVVDLAPAPFRTRGGHGPQAGARREPAPPSPEQLSALVHRMRGADTASSQGRLTGDQSSGEALTLLRHAADHRGAVWIGYVDSEGGTSRRIIEPIAVSGGTVAAFDRLRQSMRTFALHRISDVHPVHSGDSGDSGDLPG